MKRTLLNYGSSTQSRTAFTLIELLVVVSIMAVLTGLLVGGAMKFRDAQTNASTDTRVNKLQIALNDQYMDITQQGVKAKIPAELVTACGENEERARSVYTAALLKIHFPQTFAEAQQSFIIGGVLFEAKSTFKSVWSVTGTPDQESAALLYLILTTRSTGGSVEAGTAGEESQITIGGRPFKIFVDPRGQPISFYRWATNSELNVAPYSNANNPSIDPLDPKNLVGGWGGVNTLNGSPYALQFNRQNRVPCVVAYGKNKVNDNLSPASDDVFGYRLNRLGNKGGKAGP